MPYHSAPVKSADLLAAIRPAPHLVAEHQGVLHGDEVQPSAVHVRTGADSDLGKQGEQVSGQCTLNTQNALRKPRLADNDLRAVHNIEDLRPIEQ